MKKTKSVQILLRESVYFESELIKHLASVGVRSGEAKRLLLIGFREIKKNPLLYSELDCKSSNVSGNITHEQPSNPAQDTSIVYRPSSFSSMLKKR